MPPQNRCFVRGFRQFSAHLTKCHACHGICTMSLLDAARQGHSQKTSHKTRLKCCTCHEKCNSFSENDSKVVRMLRLLTRYETRLNVSCTFCRPDLPKVLHGCPRFNILKCKSSSATVLCAFFVHDFPTSRPEPAAETETRLR